MSGPAGGSDWTLKEGMPLLDENQQKAATEVVQKEREDAEEELRGKLGGGRAMQTGSPSRRGRP